MFDLPSLLIVGAKGQLGYEVEALAREEGFSVTALDRKSLDILDPQAVEKSLAEFRPDFVINAAAVINPAEQDPPAFAANTRGAAILAESCHKYGVALVHVSCAEVFGDEADQLLRQETDKAVPVSPYGKSKLRGEELVRAALTRHLIIRTGWLFSARGDSFVRELLEQARQQRCFQVADGLMGVPTSAADLARVILAVIKQLDSGADSWGTYHYCAAEALSWAGFAEAIVAAARQYEELCLEELQTCPQQQLPGRTLPANTQLDCSLIMDTFGVHQRTWRTGLMQVIQGYYSWTP
ncbi:SDR family oxidoreductase [Motiliproteus coralliicola]|uniref:SDR family oxidoreductase n=1 Tax=Motiliproteus coralliicola TaxID=2283196 RepID=UPI001402FBDC|nr:sugar nucleotide-binding protein [Motiliproteus coralliicola]